MPVADRQCFSVPILMLLEKRILVMKKKRSIVFLVLTVLLTAFLGFLEVKGMSLWTPWEIVPMVDEIKLGLDLQGGMRVIYEANFTDIDVDNKAESIQGAMDVLRTRLDAEGYTEATISLQGDNQIVDEVPGVQNAQELSKVLMTPAVLEFRAPDEKTVLLTGDDVKKAQAGYTNENGYLVALELNEEGTEKFAEATSKYKNQVIHIYLDDTCISSPNVKDTISTGEAIISGNFTLEGAQELAGLIQSGALPIPLSEIAIKSVGATLGADSLEKTIFAGLIAFVLVLIFMAIFYRLPGVMADLALIIYLVLTVIALYVFNVTLTLAGIAGIVLSVGMAVDANVVIFERIKEELHAGRSVRNAVKNGFKNAFKAVLDANVTTLIAVIVLSIFGTGTVQGFAITLGIGIVLSLLTAVAFTHTFLNWMIHFGVKNPAAYGMKKGDVINA